MPKKDRTTRKKTAIKKTNLVKSLDQPKTILRAPAAASSGKASLKFWQRGRRTKHPRPPTVKLATVWQITKTIAQLLWDHRVLFLGIVLIYGILNLILSQSLASSSDVTSLKNELSRAFHGDGSAVGSSLSTFLVFISSTSSDANPSSDAYQVILLLVVSVALIWAIRRTAAGSKINIRDAYYKGVYPLVPFVVVLVVIGLQLIPLLIGSTLYSEVITNSIATVFIEQLLWGLVFFALAFISVYWVCSSVFALYIVTLPEMTPLKALRSARDLVRYRRLVVLRKIIFMPVVLLVVVAVIMLPVIVVATALAQWVFLALTLLALPVAHAYMYTLYRELIRE